METITSDLRTTTRTSDRVEEDLRQRIICLSLEPGAPLNDRDLAKEYGCSRTPVLAALQRLAQDGLVVDIPRRGFFVTELSLATFGDVMEACTLIEAAMAPVVAENITDAELDALAAILKQAEHAVEAGEWACEAQLNDEFHCAIGRATHNHFLADTASRLQRVSTRYCYLGLNRPGDAVIALSEHRAILDTLRARDSEACRESILDNIRKGRERILAAL